MVEVLTCNQGMPVRLGQEAPLKILKKARSNIMETYYYEREQSEYNYEHDVTIGW